MRSQDDGEQFRESVEALDEAFFRMVAVRNPAGAIVDFRYDYCNEAALRILGRRREDVVGHRLLELFPLHLDNGMFDAYLRVTETGEPLRFEFSYDENGVTGEFEVLTCRLGDGHVTVGHDISERKRRERETMILSAQLQTALTSRIDIEQAKGYLAAQYGFDTATAFLAIRRYARDNNRLISDVARSIVDGELKISDSV